MTEAERDANVQDKLACEHEKQLLRQEKLLDATWKVLAQKDLNGLLQTAADAARELTGAKYAATGHGYSNGIFTTGGVSHSEGVMPCPPGQAFNVKRGGVYLDLIQKKDSIRLTDAEMRAHPAWWGLPKDHVPLRGLLGARLVDVEGQPSGLLMVSDKRDGEDFTPEDETILSQLAAIVSLALQHIEARIEAENEKRRLEAVMEALPVGVAITDAKGGNIQSNSAFEQVWGGSRPLSQSVSDYAAYKAWWADTGKPVAPEEWTSAQAAKKEQTVVGQVMEIQRFDGTRGFVINSAAPVRDARGNIVGSAVAIQDITERKRAEEAVRLSEEKFSVAFHGSVAGMAISRLHDGLIIDVNDQWLKLFGFSRDEVIGKVIVQRAWKYPEEREQIVHELEQHGAFQNREVHLRRTNGEDLIALASGRVSMLHGESVLISSMIDVTDRKLIEETARIEERRLHSIIKISQYNPKSVQELLDYALDEAIALSESKLGYILYYNEEKQEFTIHAWSKEAMKECSIARPPTTFQLDKTGIWGEAVRQRQPIIINDFLAPNPLKKGYPEGHVHLFRFMTVPVFIDDRIVAVVAVANKATDYSDQDVHQLSMMMDSVWVIAERKRMDEELQESEERFRLVADFTYDWETWLDPKGNYNYVSPSCERITGYHAEEFIKNPQLAIDLVHPDDREDFKNHRNIHFKGQTSSGQIDYRIVTKNGKTRWINHLCQPVFGRNGEWLGRRASNRDITERKRSEEQRQALACELADRVAELQAMLDTAPVAVWIAHDPQCHRITGNSYADKILHAPHGGNVSRSALPGDAVVTYKVFRKGAELEPKEMPAHVATATGKPVIGEELELLFPDGRTVHLIESAVPLFDAEGKVRGAIIAGADVTQLELAEEELRRAKDKLEQRVKERTADLSQAKEDLEVINEELQVELEQHRKLEADLIKAKEAAEAATKAKAEFLANMSHEIRTPMNAIIGMTGLMLEDPLPPEQRDNLELIRTNGDALLTIINDILDFSKMESNKVVLEEQPFNLRALVEESLDLVAIKASEKGLNLAYTIDKNVPDTIIGDPGRLRQILGNLLSNAVKFTDEGEVILSVSIQKNNDAQEVHFAVQDTGIGIPADSMNLLFQPFSQMEPSTTRLYGGTGLGLAISKKLVELMGGQIWADSEEGKGSTFHFTIKTSSSQSEPQLAIVSPQLVGKRVFMVSDNKTNRRILGKQVYSWGMIPMIVASGHEALSWVQRGDDFDIAILDMDMQDMNSLDLGKEIRKYNKTLPLVLLTSIGQRIPPNHAYLTKPIKPSQLHRVLTEILFRQSDQRAVQAHAVSQPSQNNPLRILMAEDNVSSQKVALQMLKKLGYKADTVANGIEALQALERQYYDLVLMDVRMPEMDGLEATRIIRQRWPNGPKIIAITAYALEGDREKFIEVGMDDYIAKPVKMDELAKVLSKYQPQ